MCDCCETVDTQLADEYSDTCTYGPERGEMLRLYDESYKLRSLVARMVEAFPQDHELVSEANCLL